MANANDGGVSAPASAPASAPLPAAISVVVTSSGELDQLDRSLDALVRQDLPARYDIIVVDDEPDPAKGRMVAQWASRGGSHGAALRYLPNQGERHGPAVARNLGWQAADAPIVAFTSDETVAAVDWLRQALAPFAVTAPGQPPDAVVGSVASTLPKHPTEFQFTAHLRDCGEFAGCNWFCRRSVLEHLGGFDERFADGGAADADMHFRLLEAGIGLGRAPGATVAHPVPPAGWGASLSQLRTLSGEALLYKKHPRLYREKIRRPPDWHDVGVVATLALALCGLWLHHEVLAVAAGGTWLVLTAMLCIRRLRDTAKTPSHVAAVLATSVFLPPVALFWRLVGAVRHRVRYA
ncbi:glycosyltransferase family 2 protein [Massilia sp. DWR3-1-1]|uniref:glycosyltransferase family 2 protein n=1 Tax=Massilia sp. DWR3-1-1 TaxID=2804559 RepID=UPI003CF25BAB